jgi:hypothetical protein
MHKKLVQLTLAFMALAAATMISPKRAEALCYTFCCGPDECYRCCTGNCQCP